MNFHEKIMHLRKAQGLSQEELGNRVNVTRQTVSKWELGQTTPEMDKLIELINIFDITIDELVGKPSREIKPTHVIVPLSYFEYEYKSQKKIFGIPLVHINIGRSRSLKQPCAKGIIAIGNIAQGVISIGVVSAGVFSFGAVSIGGLALGALSLGLAAVGGFAVGGVAIGGLAVGIYSIGGCAIARNIAMGGYAQGHIAIGAKASGDFIFTQVSILAKNNYENIKTTILREYPKIWKWLLNLFV